MYNPSTDWIEQIKHIIGEALGQQQFVVEGLVTSIDQNAPYKVKVMLEPYQIETGWLRIASPYVGNGFGLVLPAPEEGTPVKVIFDLGNIGNGTVIACVFNDNSPPPALDDPGDAALVHKSGSKIVIAKDGTITLESSGTVNVTAESVNLGGPGGAAIARAGDSVTVNTTTGHGTIDARSSNIKSV